jgi:hypothetical protein
MNNQQPTYEQHLRREKVLYRYTNALERGDADALAAVLQEAEYDVTLEHMLVEAHEAYRLEMGVVAYMRDEELIRQLLQQYLPSGLTNSIEEVEIPPLTVSDIVARLQSEAAVTGSVQEEVASVIQKLRQDTTPLPQSLSLKSTRRLFIQLGVSVSDRFQKLFRETAIFLSMGREQGMAQLAATRRQQHQTNKQKSEQEQPQSKQPETQQKQEEQK